MRTALHLNPGAVRRTSRINPGNQRSFVPDDVSVSPGSAETNGHWCDGGRQVPMIPILSKSRRAVLVPAAAWWTIVTSPTRHSRVPDINPSSIFTLLTSQRQIYLVLLQRLTRTPHHWWTESSVDEQTTACVAHGSSIYKYMNPLVGIEATTEWRFFLDRLLTWLVTVDRFGFPRWSRMTSG